MIYNSNGNNAPYQTGGNAKVQKELKALQEAINLVDANFNNYVDENDEDIVRIDNNIDAIELSVSDIGTRLSTAEGKLAGYDTLVETNKVQAQDADFHNVVAGKYVFQNGAAITGTNICKLAAGSVVYATDGTNAILIDYTDKDAWVAKAKVEDNQYFRLYSNGVLTFTQSGGWNVYVLGNDFSTDDFTIPEETPIEVVTGVTIGGTLYAALARDYEFDNITVTSATINSATVTLLTAPSATITDLTATNETVADLTVTDEADINGLVNAKRNIQDEVNGKISVDSHPTNVQVYIGVHKFTGTYNVKLTHEVNGAVQTLFTATIIWNGKYPIVQYHEYADNEPVDYLYSMVLTDDALYFVTQGAGNLYYSYDTMGGALAPTTSEYPNIPYQPNDVIADYITAYHDRTVFFGNHEDETGIDILGEMKADIIQLPDDFSITDLYIDNNLVVGGATTLTGDTTAGNITQDGNFSTTGKVEADKLYGTGLGINDTGTDTPTTTYLSADENGVAVNVDTTITGDVSLTGDVALTGDLTQTGDQDITGSVTVSETEVINELEPVEGGHYVDHDYWEVASNTNGEVYKIYTDNYAETSTELGTKKDTVVLANNLEKSSMASSYSGRFGLIKTQDENGEPLVTPGSPIFANEVLIFNNETVYRDSYDDYGQTHHYFYPWTDRDNETYTYGRRYRNDFFVYMNNSTPPFSIIKFAMINDELYGLYETNNTYYKFNRNTVSGLFEGGNWSAVTNQTEISTISGYTFETVEICSADQFYYLVLKSFNKTEAVYDHPQISASYHAALNTITDTCTLSYVPHEEYVREIDPNHQYTPADEVLTVKGSEKVTRDLKVQGFIYQDEYNRAVLPNINANTINSNGGVLIIGELD